MVWVELQARVLRQPRISCGSPVPLHKPPRSVTYQNQFLNKLHILSRGSNNPVLEALVASWVTIVHFGVSNGLAKSCFIRKTVRWSSSRPHMAPQHQCLLTALLQIPALRASRCYLINSGPETPSPHAADSPVACEVHPAEKERQYPAVFERCH